MGLRGIGFSPDQESRATVDTQKPMKNIGWDPLECNLPVFSDEDCGSLPPYPPVVFIPGLVQGIRVALLTVAASMDILWLLETQG